MLTLEVPATVLASHTAAGQYVKLRTIASPERQSKTSYFAIASSPPRPTVHPSTADWLSILLKDSPANDAFWQASSLEISTALGGGFGIEDALSPANRREEDENPYEHVLLVATGTGAAPIAAAIDSIVSSPQRRRHRARPRRITLLLGVRQPNQLPFTHRMQQWVADHDVRVVPVFSQVAAEPAESPSPFEPFALTEDVTLPAHYGYVQDVVPQALADAIPDLVPAPTASPGLLRATGPTSPLHTLVLLCGQPDMMAAVTDLCLNAGVPANNIRKNF
eukprot:gene4712-3376_t